MYVLSAWMKSTGVGGSGPLRIFLVERDSSGNILKTSTGASIQHLVTGDVGTTAWNQKGLVFTTDSRCAQGYFYANIYGGYGTAWLDKIELRPVTGAIVSSSFETGSGTPAGWTLGSGSTGTWSWDSTNASDGTRSIKLVIPGTTSVGSANAVSSRFPLQGGQNYVLTAMMKSSGAGGSTPQILFLVELDASGNILKTSTGASIQHATKGDFGTIPWSQKTLAFTTDARCAQAYLYANVYRGYGTSWVDTIQVYK
jgi:hypothetical protein